MSPQEQMQGPPVNGRHVAFPEVVAEIQKTANSIISVPALSKLLGVKATTLNARFRRQKTGIKTEGRTNFVPVDLALGLAQAHRYALSGWPTLRQASRLTGIKTGTIKARCEKGLLEGHIDLTKRLRINPEELKDLHLCRAWELRPKVEARVPVEPRSRRALAPEAPSSDGMRGTRNELRRERACHGRLDWTPSRAQPFVLRPVPEPKVSVISRKDYGLLEAEDRPAALQNPSRQQAPKEVEFPGLSYNPDRPLPVSDCVVGKCIRYGSYTGTILKVIDEPFSPRILVNFPDHQHPLMREVLLVVGKDQPRRG